MDGSWNEARTRNWYRRADTVGTFRGSRRWKKNWRPFSGAGIRSGPGGARLQAWTPAPQGATYWTLMNVSAPDVLEPPDTVPMTVVKPVVEGAVTVKNTPNR